MQPIRTEDEFTCQKKNCDRESTVKIEFNNATYVLCEVHEKEFAEQIREEYV